MGHEFDELEISNLSDVLERGGRMRGHIRSRNLFQLLGIHWGQFPEKWELRDKSKLLEEFRMGFNRRRRLCRGHERNDLCHSCVADNGGFRHANSQKAPSSRYCRGSES